jgi:tetratricopeptide (TPR) repeat protein
VRQKLLIVLAIVALLGAIGGCSEQRLAALERQFEGILAIEDAAERSAAALAFAVENAAGPEELDDLLERGVDTAVESAEEAGGPDAAFEVWEAFYAAEATPDRHYTAMAQYDRALIESGEPDRIARAEELARELLAADDAPGMPYIWMTYFHSSSDLTDKELVVDVARAGYANAQPEDADTWPSMLDRAYGAYIGEMSATEGLDVAIENTEALAVGADDPLVAGVLRANIYRLAIEDSPGTAMAAVSAIAASEDFGSWQILNDLAYDMAERDIEPDLALELAGRAIELAPSRYDSAMVLDTVGWVTFRTGDSERAADHLEKAVSFLEETPTFDNTLVQHLVEVYRSGGMDDRAIDFLAVMVARSLDTDDPARALLARMLTTRDGSPAALEDLVASRRYDGVIAAPAFALPNRAGETVALADLKGDVVLVAFWGYG